MTNVQVCNAFANGMTAHSLNMTSTGDKLFSYSTIIAQRTPKGIILNGCKYSVTTSKQQTYARRALEKKGLAYTEVNDYICRGTSDLTRYLRKEAA